jgi:hypothetical protein
MFKAKDDQPLLAGVGYTHAPHLEQRSGSHLQADLVIAGRDIKILIDQVCAIDAH